MTEREVRLESALSELISKVLPGRDSGNLLCDAKAASRALDGKPSFVECPCPNSGYCDGSCAPYNGGGGTGLVAAPTQGADDCHQTCDVCWDDQGGKWPCAKKAASKVQGADARLVDKSAGAIKEDEYPKLSARARAALGGA
jgi:hypothetical protein